MLHSLKRLSTTEHLNVIRHGSFFSFGEKTSSVDDSFGPSTSEEPSSNILTIEENDRIRARGMLRFTESYYPPQDFEESIKNTVTGLAKVEDQNWRQIDLSKNPRLKFDLLTMLEKYLSLYSDSKKADHKTVSSYSVPNDCLHQMRVVQDVINYYAMNFPNINVYRQMARNSSLPPNCTIIETPKLFHPDDKHEIHGGITAFPGMSRAMKDSRDKRLYRSFRGQKEWFEWDDSSFEANSISSDAPWAPDMVKKLDTISYWRYPKANNFGKEKKPEYYEETDLF